MDRKGAEKTSGVNRLIREKSPYLLQHAENPVHWYPWGEEAFSRAREENKPIFLSIGYSTCHWCHVMAHESFAAEEVARLLNESFVSIKVDREERPDIDLVYMAACQAITLSGGWPLSIFMTPEARPFYAGTYFPKTSRQGLPGLVDILKKIAEAWQRDRSALIRWAEKITTEIQPKEPKEAGPPPGPSTLAQVYEQLQQAFDPQWGGFGSAPKFPSPENLLFLLRWHRRNGQGLEMVEKSLGAMRRGGIYDQLGFGFHRYSVDRRWLVPHFEKMLYDQAMLIMAYAEAYQVTGNQGYARVVGEITTYVLREMSGPEGGFYTAEDADSEGREGFFYLWSPEQVRRHLSADLADLFCRFYDIGPQGNFEAGLSIPHIRVPLAQFADRENMDAGDLERLLDQAREKLFLARQKRPHPLKDDKVLTAWNGLMIAALARAYQVPREELCLDAAVGAADFILAKLKRPESRLWRRYRQGEAAYPAYADDYAFLVWALIELYEAASEQRYLSEALALNQSMIELFWDDAAGGFFFSGRENEPLITRTKEIYDGPMPSSNAVAMLNLVRLGRIVGDQGLTEKARALTTTFAGRLTAFPAAHTFFMLALDLMLGPEQQ